jgi:hypothetical protein
MVVYRLDVRKLLWLSIETRYLWLIFKGSSVIRNSYLIRTASTCCTSNDDRNKSVQVNL